VRATNGHAAGAQVSSGRVHGTAGAALTANGLNGAGTNGHAVDGVDGHARAGAAGAAFLLPMRGLTRILEVDTERHVEFADITDEVIRAVGESGVQHGFAVVFSRHTTAGIRINEHEPLLLEDMARLLDQLVPADCAYRHDDFSVRTVNLTENERVNGHSHCRSLLLGASETVPVAGGRLLLGRWQRIFVVELDGPNHREIVVQVIGS
jgi:secondary thiamine-phosphate synthase enzyme